MKLLLFMALFLVANAAQAQDYRLRSPDGKTEVQLRLKDKIQYSITYNGTTIIQPSAIALQLADNKALTKKPVVENKQERPVNTSVYPVVRQKRRVLVDRYNELKLTFKGGFALIWRAYDDGVAYRWATALPNDITVKKEEVNFTFANPQDVVFWPEEQSLYSHNERLYVQYGVKNISDKKFASLPALVETRAGVRVWLGEADLYDYAGMWLKGTGGNALTGLFPNYPAEEKLTSDRDLRVTKRADFIAKTKGTRNFPWRVIGLAETDAALLNNQLVYLLSEDTKEDFSWVRPGKVPWDWWNANNIYGVEFKSGLNLETYKFYIDFAARYGLEYLVLDEGWSNTKDLFALNSAVNLPELLAYAKQKKVGVILWMVWTTLDQQFDRAFEQFGQWGVAGLKVDFMQRDDQKGVNFYEKVAREAAKHKLLVDFHGAYKPTGMERKYPNVITREGVVGLEHSKWSPDQTPAHAVTLPFIRMVAGPMDYTPGAMHNATKNDFHHIFANPMSQGTRCHQLAMYVIYESPLQMLADNPANYLREPEAMEFLSAVPTVWDETVALDGRVGEYVVMARKTDQGEWYVGAMTNWTKRELTLDFSFLDAGNYRADIWQDGVNADRVGHDFKKLSREVKKGDKWTVNLAPGGGWVARISR